jgi:hypothetical protein
MFRFALPALCVLLAACSTRPETPDYFRSVTGLPLCRGATVRNVNADSPDRSPGFDSIYIVDVAMPAACKPSFINAVAGRISAACDASHVCSGHASTGEFYGVEPLAGGFRVTHSTLGSMSAFDPLRTLVPPLFDGEHAS